MSIKQVRENQIQEDERKAAAEAKKAAEEALKELAKTITQATTADDQAKLKNGDYKPVMDANGKIVGFGTKYNKQKIYPCGAMVLLTGNTPEELEADEKAADEFWAAHGASIRAAQKQVMTAYELNEAEIEPEEEAVINGKKYFIINKTELMDETGKTVASLTGEAYAGCEDLPLNTRRTLLEALMKK